MRRLRWMTLFFGTILLLGLWACPGQKKEGGRDAEDTARTVFVDEELGQMVSKFNDQDLKDFILTLSDKKFEALVETLPEKELARIDRLLKGLEKKGPSQ